MPPNIARSILLWFSQRFCGYFLSHNAVPAFLMWDNNGMQQELFVMVAIIVHTCTVSFTF